MDASTLKLGRNMAFLALLFFLVYLAGRFFVWSGDMLEYGNYHLLLERQFLLRLTMLAGSIAGLMGVAVVLAGAETLRHWNPGLIRWAGFLGAAALIIASADGLVGMHDNIQRAFAQDSLLVSYDGIGIEMQKDAEGNILVAAFDESPAKEAGLKSGSILLEMNGAPVTPGTTIKQVQELIKKETGSLNTLVVRTRSGEQQELQMKYGPVFIWERGAQSALYYTFSTVDPMYFFTLGVFGFWLAVMGWGALQAKVFMKLVGWFSLVVGLLLVGLTLPAMLGYYTLESIRQVVLVAGYPAWLILMCLSLHRLLRLPQTVVQPAAQPV